MRLLTEIKGAAQNPKKQWRKWPIPVGAVLVVGLAGVFFLKSKEPGTPKSEESRAAEQLVTAAAVTLQKFVRTAPVSGEARPVHDIRVFAPAPGVRIAEVMAELGDRVEEGQPLARLDSELAGAQVREAEALLRQAQIEYRRAADGYERIAPIADTGALSVEEVSTKRSAMDAANASLTAQKAAYAQVAARMGGGFVRAPASGLVIERNARIGEYADQTALFRIVGENRLEVAAAVSEADILSLKAGQIAIFSLNDGAIVEAILRVAPVAVNSTSRAGEALFDLPAEAPVRAGMYLRGEVAIEHITALGVPRTAISYATGEPSVFVISGGKARLTPVKLGMRTGDRVAILSGLKEGDMVASAGGAFLLDGDAVRTTAGADGASSGAT